MIRTLAISIFTLFICLFFTACVKDTDFDQAEDISLSPIMELDLIYFNLQASDFFDTLSGTPILTLRDTTKIKFLDDSTLQESLKRVDFYFKFTNSIPRSFQVDFEFLSEENHSTYITGTVVEQGEVSTPEITEFTHIVENEAISQLTLANKVVVSVTIPSSDQNLQGTLNMKSKTTYFLEY